MLALLFDKPLRERFLQNPVTTLNDYALSEDERADFLCIRTDGLAFDANLRIDLLLSQMAKHYPLSMALQSSMPEGLEALKAFIDLEWIKQPSIQRPMLFGLHMKNLFAGADEQATLMKAILEAELAMTYTAAQLRGSAQQGMAIPDADEVHEVPDNWSSIALTLAENTNVSVIPLPYEQLKQALCPYEGAALWHHLSSTPVDSGFRNTLLATPDMRLFVAKAVASDISSCDMSVEFVTIELSSGFASLLPHLDGKNSVDHLLQQMKAAGAQPSLVSAIRNGFRQMLERGLLIIA